MSEEIESSDECRCGEPLSVVDCWNGCDDGYFDGYEEDPLWYDMGEMYACLVCRGHGVLVFCRSCEQRDEERYDAGIETLTFC